MALTVCREGQAGAQILFGQLGEITQDFRVRHPGSHVAKHVRDADSHTSNAGLPAPLTRFDGNEFPIIKFHANTLTALAADVKLNEESSLAQTELNQPLYRPAF
jgi:hypothetical protein